METIFVLLGVVFCLWFILFYKNDKFVQNHLDTLEAGEDAVESLGALGGYLSKKLLNDGSPQALRELKEAEDKMKVIGVKMEVKKNQKRN